MIVTAVTAVAVMVVVAVVAVVVRSRPATVAPASAVRVTPAPVAFGSQTVGTTSGGRAVVVRDEAAGRAVAAIGSVTVTGTNAEDFAVTKTSCAAVRIPSGQGCSVVVSFRPAAPGTRQATLLVARTDARASVTVALSGEGTSSPVTAEPSAVVFGQIATGATSTTQSVTLTNNASTPVAVHAVALSGVGAPDFSEGQGCTGATLAPHAQCQVAIAFMPAIDGDQVATLTITHDGSGSPTVVALSGAGAPLKMRIAPARLDFGLQRITTVSAPLAVTISTPLMTVVPVGAVTVSGADAAEFSVAVNGCTGATLAPARSCTVTVTFTPTQSGDQLATLTVSRAHEATPAGSVALSGFGTAK